ncbi:hypothetical protein ES702_02424 [subsurface metagenome]
MPPFDITIPEESIYQLTTKLDGLSLLVLLKQVNPQETLVGELLAQRQLQKQLKNTPIISIQKY